MYERKWTLQVVGVLFAALLTASAVAQEKPRLLLNKDSSKPADPGDKVFLRPNLQQGVYFYVQNPGEDAKKFTVVIKTGEEGAEVAKADIMVDAGKVGRVVFPKPKPAVAPAPGAAEPPPMFTKLDGPPFKFQAVLLDGATVIEKKDVTVDVLHPTQYIEPPKIKYDIGPMGLTNKLTVEVAAKGERDFTGPDCKVELLLDPNRIPGMIKSDNPRGSFQFVLKRPGQSGELFAQNLEFRDIKDIKGLIYLHADKYQRAFIFESSFDKLAGTVTPSPLNKPSARFDSDFYYRKSAAELKFSLEVDNVKEANAVVEYGMDRDGNGEFIPDELSTKVGARDQQLGFGPAAADGGILFNASVSDWALQIDTEGIKGERELRVQVLVNKKPIAEGKARLVIDDSPPEKAEIVGLPANAARGAMVALKGTGVDRQSGIKEVQFFFGEPTADGKVPPNTKLIPAQPPAKTDGEWSAMVVIPADKKGPLPVSVRVVNNVDLDRIVFGSIDVVEPGGMANAGGAATKITGQVTEGDRPQPKQKVIVRDPAGAEKYSGETDKDGKYSIPDVKPGMYKVSCFKESSQTKGEKPVTVEAGKEHKVDLQLFR